MLQQFAHKLTQNLLDMQIVKEEDKEIYQYGMEALISTLVNTVIVVIIGMLTGLLKETLIYLISFAILRVYSGGYHAKTHLGCILTFLTVFCSFMVCALIIPVDLKGPLSLVLGTGSLIAIFAMAPIEHANRPFAGDEYKSFKRMSRLIAASEWLLIMVFTLWIPSFVPVAFLITTAMMSVVSILALAKIIDERGE
ncbi:MAG: accessory gene regulator B family protein [Clostridia bacterium]|nr:accessory gene regulator B family protein [Clostridia bacterium]